jgi:Zn-dependent protease
VFANEPPETSYDINFSLFGIPVRIHPFFFALPLLWGANWRDPFVLLLFPLIFLVSILIHELGHSVAMLAMGQRSRIVLYSMGGLAIPESYGRRSNRTSREQILISIAGPAAGLLLALFLIGVARSLGATVSLFWAWNVLPVPQLDFGDSSIRANFYLALLLELGVLINVWMNLMNLLPVIPLDGGQILREILLERDPWNGMRNALKTSFVIGALVAVVGLSNRETFLALFFGYLAINNFQTLQMGGPGSFGGRRPW